MLTRMFEKGDNLKPQYKNFDFSGLDDQQHKTLKALTFFSRHKNWLKKKFDGTTITSDVKIIFIDQHSMKMG